MSADSIGNKPSVSLAKKRWQLLARALSQSIDFERDNSVRRFTSFGLLEPINLQNAICDDTESTWWEYSANIDGELFDIQIRHIKKAFTANELIGFNNTGNVCVWPSEECLAYYLLKNRGICRNRNVLELGGGMSCLAGVLAAKYCNPRSVTLTDGNVLSVDNVRCIVTRNGLADFVRCGVVQWAKAANVFREPPPGINGNCVQTLASEIDEFRGTKNLYEVILCADCLFFDETRLDLIETIYGWLTQDGIALVMAPRRGTTFQKFLEAAIEKGFIVSQTESYDETVWSRHLEHLQTNPDYCQDLHYPVLLGLSKKKTIPPC